VSEHEEAPGRGGEPLEWNPYEGLFIGDVDQPGIQVGVVECPKCAAVVRYPNRGKHERVCWSE
jgi:hypothetical protein